MFGYAPDSRTWPVRWERASLVIIRTTQLNLPTIPRCGTCWPVMENRGWFARRKPLPILRKSSSAGIKRRSTAVVASFGAQLPIISPLFAPKLWVWAPALSGVCLPGWDINLGPSLPQINCIFHIHELGSKFLRGCICPIFRIFRGVS